MFERKFTSKPICLTLSCPCHFRAQPAICDARSNGFGAELMIWLLEGADQIQIKIQPGSLKAGQDKEWHARPTLFGRTRRRGQRQWPHDPFGCHSLISHAFSPPTSNHSYIALVYLPLCNFEATNMDSWRVRVKYRIQRPQMKYFRLPIVQISRRMGSG